MTLSAVINPVVTLNLLFPLQRVVCPQSRQAAKYRIVTHNFTNDNLTNGKSPSHQSLVNIPPAPLTAPPRHRGDHGTRNPDSLLRDRFSRRTCPVSPSDKKPCSPSVKISTSLIPMKSRRPSQNLPISRLPQQITPREDTQKVSHLRESASRQAVIIFPRNGRK